MMHVSTGGFSTLTGYEAALLLLDNGINFVELSGGKCDEQQLKKLLKLKSDAVFQIHNYFPPPKDPFVLNLASLDHRVGEMSINHIKRAVRFAAEMESEYYSFHAGFLLDPNVKELGGPIFRKKLFERRHALETFIDRVNLLDKYSKSLGVKLLIENNVLSDRNYTKFGDDPFLMTTSAECCYVMKCTSSNVNLLIDVGHLKVSSESLKFNPVNFLIDCDKWIGGYHLSDNNGKHDANDVIDEKAWFWPHLRKDMDYYTVEVYDVDIGILSNQLKLAKDMIGY